MFIAVSRTIAQHSHLVRDSSRIQRRSSAAVESDLLYEKAMVEVPTRSLGEPRIMGV